jgi:hypothetical protein
VLPLMLPTFEHLRGCATVESQPPAQHGWSKPPHATQPAAPPVQSQVLGLQRWMPRATVPLLQVRTEPSAHCAFGSRPNLQRLAAVSQLPSTMHLGKVTLGMAAQFAGGLHATSVSPADSSTRTPVLEGAGAGAGVGTDLQFAHCSHFAQLSH